MHSQPLGYAIATNTLGKAALFPSYTDGMSYNDSHELSHSPQGYPLHHEPGCTRFGAYRYATRERSRSTAGIEKSITSLHSSGHDSGIADGAVHCQCGHTSSQSSEDSSK